MDTLQGMTDAGTTPDAATDVAAPDATTDASGDASHPAGPPPWDWTELLRDPAPAAPVENFTAPCERSGELATAFGSPRPDRSLALLHHYPSSAPPTRPEPVLLVHGAATDATQSFGPQPFGADSPGLAAYLAARGHDVYAITFAHPHGEVIQQARMVSLAVARVRTLRGDGALVQLVSHSKGGAAAFADLALGAETGVSNWVAVAAPLAGIDFAFAYSSGNWAVIANNTCGPLSWDRAYVNGAWVDTLSQSLYAGGSFPGQPEILARWDSVLGLPAGQSDGVTTYYGGDGFASHSQGIDAAIAQGGGLMARLADAGIPSGVGFTAIAGDVNVIAGVVGEARATSDGLLLLASAHALDAVHRVTNATNAVLLHENHLGLVTADESLAAIASALEAAP